MMKDFLSLRNEVRSTAPDATVGEPCKDPAIREAFETIEKGYEEISKAHPEYSVMQLRKEFYQLLRATPPIKIFRNSPFYFYAGINGGWLHSPAKTCFLSPLPLQAFYKKNVPEADYLKYRARVENRFILCCGPYVDQVHHLPPFTRVLQKGFKGIREEILAELKKPMTPEEREFLETAQEGLLAIHSIQKSFAKEAEKIKALPDLTMEEKKFMTMAAASAARCPWEPPATFYEGLNTLLFVREILALIDPLSTYALGSPDAMLQDLYKADLAAGRITQEEAYDLICRFLIICDSHYDGMRQVRQYGDHELEIPVTIGGCDKEGNVIYNDITRFILRAHRELDLVYPKLHCRVGKNSPDEYIRELAKDVHNGHCVHTLFNDDSLIPGLLRQGKTLEEARRYICAGCWNSNPDSVENNDDANYFSLARILESMIYQDEGQEEKYGFHFAPLDNCRSFEELRDLVTENITGFLRLVLEDYTRYGKLFARICPHPVYSVCLEGCIRNRKDETRGGARYNSRFIVLAFLANVVDSLLAMDYICFRKKVCTLPEFLQIVRNNYEGKENIRALAMKAPYWGDNTKASRELGKDILNSLQACSGDLLNERGGEYLYCLWIYREFRYWGEKMRALPDGRRNGDPLSQGLNPSDFRNREEATTTLNALSCLDYTRFASSNINMTFDKNRCTQEHLFSFFKAFIDLGLQILQPNSFSREELEEAMLHPEKHRNLIVKVCGFSARFVTLEPSWQKIIMARHPYS